MAKTIIHGVHKRNRANQVKQIKLVKKNDEILKKYTEINRLAKAAGEV